MIFDLQNVIFSYMSPVECLIQIWWHSFNPFQGYHVHEDGKHRQLVDMFHPNKPAGQFLCVCVCVLVCLLSVAGVCLCLHQRRPSEKAEWGGVCQARSFAVVPKQHGYCCGDTEAITVTMATEVRGCLHLVVVHTHTLKQPCVEPNTPASYHPHTHIQVVWILNKVSWCACLHSDKTKRAPQERLMIQTSKQEEGDTCFWDFSVWFIWSCEDCWYVSVITESHSCGLGHFFFPLIAFYCLYLHHSILDKLI